MTQTKRINISFIKLHLYFLSNLAKLVELTYNKIMKIVDKISVAELQSMAEKMFGNIVKADVDVVRRVMIVDMSMHFEGEQVLLENGSKQADLWGINLHPQAYGTENFIEFDSMINIRPAQGNVSRSVLDEGVRRQIEEIIGGIVYE